MSADGWADVVELAAEAGWEGKIIGLFPEGFRAVWLGEGNSSGATLAELLPIEKPIPKNTAHRTTSPKNKASILLVPRVISVSVTSSMRAAVKGAMGKID